MKVKELIEALKECDQEAIVAIESYHYISNLVSIDQLNFVNHAEVHMHFDNKGDE